MALPTQMIGGLVSGFDTVNIIEQLMSIERKPLQKLENRKLEHQTKLEAYRGINNLLLEFRKSVTQLSSNSLWNTKHVSSTNESALTATAGSFAEPGTYQFRVGQLAQRAQYLSGGFADRASSPVSPAQSGEIRIDSALSRVNNGTDLNALNGGQGIYHGSIKITDRAGNSAVVDLSTTVTVEDVLHAINSADGVRVNAAVNRWQSGDAWSPPYGDRLVITDTSGGSGNLTIDDLAGGRSASDLGIEGSVAGDRLIGSSVYSLSGLTPLASLRDGLGINDGGAGTIQIQDDSLSAAMQSTVFGTTLLDDLNNGSGVNGGTANNLSFTDASTNGGAAFTVSLTGVETMDDLVTRINNTIQSEDPDSTLRATLASDNRGLAFENADNLTITDSGTSAADLGLDGITFNGTQDAGDLDPVRLAKIDLTTILQTLNAGAGINGGTPGSITLSDAGVNGGAAFDVDLSSATTVEDVVDTINDAIVAQDPAAALRVRISAGSKALHFTDADTLTIDNTGGVGTTAQDLGIQFVAPEAGPDAVGADITPANKPLSVDLSGAKTVQAVVDTINNAIEAAAPASTLRAEVDPTGFGFRFVNASNLTARSEGEGNSTAEDLGIDFTGVSGTATGEGLMADLNSVRVNALSGKNATGINGTSADPGADLGGFVIRANGATDFTVDLTALDGFDSLDDAIDYMNYQAQDVHGLDIAFRVNDARNGISVENTGTDSYEILQWGATTTAADLGFDGLTVAAGESTNAGDLDRRYVSRATRLDALNSGTGVYAGRFRITDADGLSAEVSTSGVETLGDLIDRIHGFALNIKARINDTGDGLLLYEVTDSGTEQNILVEEVSGGSTAADLGLLGAGTGGSSGLSVLNGSFEKTISVDTNDTLSDIMFRIADSGARVDTSVISDGSTYAPYRLVINSKDTGRVGDFVMDTDLAAFNFNKTSEGVDSVLLYGTGSSSSSPLLVTSSTNTNNNAVLGLDLRMTQTTTGFVSITIDEDSEPAAEAVQGMVDSYNTLHDLVGELDNYDSETETPGILFADNATRGLMSSLSDLFFTTVSGVESGISSFYDVGVNFTREGKLSLDTSALGEKLRNDFQSVRDLFTLMTDVARKDLNAGASATDAAGNDTDPQGLINGNTDSKDFGAGNGYQSLHDIDPAGTGVTVNFGSPRKLSRLTLNHIDTADMPAAEYALRDFTVEYLDALSGNWEELRNIKGNNQAHTYLGFAQPTLVNSLRVTATNSNSATDNKFRLVEIEAFESQGIANRMDETFDELMDSQTGFFAEQQATLQNQIEDIDDTIEGMEERLESHEVGLIRQFTAMETALARMQSQSDFFFQQMDALSGNNKK